VRCEGRGVVSRNEVDDQNLAIVADQPDVVVLREGPRAVRRGQPRPALDPETSIRTGQRRTRFGAESPNLEQWSVRAACLRIQRVSNALIDVTEEAVAAKDFR
jgi:hypothetical protein